jgi:hypothetical protein
MNSSPLIRGIPAESCFARSRAFPPGFQKVSSAVRASGGPVLEVPIAEQEKQSFRNALDRTISLHSALAPLGYRSSHIDTTMCCAVARLETT